MDAMTFAASRLAAYRDADLRRDLALRASRAARAEARTSGDGGSSVAVCTQQDLALAGPSR